MQEVANQLARLSLRACARLGGFLGDDLASPDNPAVKKSLSSMLTPYLTRKLATKSLDEVNKENSLKQLCTVLKNFDKNPSLVQTAVSFK